MKRFVPVLAALAALVLLAPAATAAVYTAQLARLLGWDAKHARIYVQIDHEDVSEFGPTIWYFDLDSGSPATPHYLDWSGTEREVNFERRHAALVKSVRPLVPDESIGSFTCLGNERAAFLDSIRGDDGLRARYVARVRPERSRDDVVRVMTLDPDRHAVRLLRLYRIPGRDVRLAILSTEEVPLEEGYEVQFPVLLGAPGTPDPVDPGGFDVRR